MVITADELNHFKSRNPKTDGCYTLKRLQDDTVFVDTVLQRLVSDKNPWSKEDVASIVEFAAYLPPGLDVAFLTTFMVSNSTNSMLLDSSRYGKEHWDTIAKIAERFHK